MVIYPYTSPIILTEDIYQQYVGNDDLSKGSSEQRQAAFVIAEMVATEDLNTFLLPTTVTGTYLYNPTQTFFLDHTYLQSVEVVRFLDTKEDVYYSVTGTNNVYVSIGRDDRGVLDIHWLVGNCGCSSLRPYPYKVQVAYEAGLPTGTATQPDILLGLSTYADIVLNEIIGYGNESPGDVGVQNYGNQSYREGRVALLRTNYGTSPRAQFVHGLFSKLRKKRFVGLGL